jgi:CheY-like chemotaxis protein
VPAVLVVDDSSVDRILAGRLLARGPDMQVSFAENGRAALDAIRASAPDIVVSDLQMPEMNGLDLVDAIRRDHPGLPIVLMTARGSEAIASEALKRGAAGYVPKGALATHLEPTVDRLLAAVHADRQHSRLMHSLVGDECSFLLRNDLELIDPLVAHLQEMLRCMRLDDESERLRVGVVIGHALRIAHDHGNLEIPLDRLVDDEAFQTLADERRSAAPGASRSLQVRARVSPDEMTVTIRYQGSPISIGSLPANLEEEAVDRQWLSRFVLLSAVMNEVIFDPREPKLMLLKKAAPAADDRDMEIG